MLPYDRGDVVLKDVNAQITADRRATRVYMVYNAGGGGLGL